MKIGVLLVGFNEAERIKKRIANFKRNLEKPACDTTILIIDNGSFDETFKILSEIKEDNKLNDKYRILVDRIDDNQGYPVAFNKGIGILKAEQIDIIVTLSLKSKPDEKWLCEIEKAVSANRKILSFSGIEVDSNDPKIVQRAGHYQKKMEH